MGAWATVAVGGTLKTCNSIQNRDRNPELEPAEAANLPTTAGKRRAMMASDVGLSCLTG